MTDKSNLERISDEKFRAVCEKVVKEMDRLPVPGVVLGVRYGDQEWIAPFGITSVENPLQVDEDTLFQIGSITKTFLGTAVMRLVAEGKLDLDTPVCGYLPELTMADETVTPLVTMRHLLTHTGGWVGDYFNDFGRGEDALAKMVAQMAHLPQITPLGEVYSYNNAGFYLAGRVIEAVTGKSFEAALQELVFNPLDLKMCFFFTDDVITHRFASGHRVVQKQPLVARPWAVGRAVHPAGGIITTARDLLRYAGFHIGDGTAPDGTRLLPRALLEQMQTPLIPSTGISSIGLTWAIASIDDTKFFGHGGATNGQESMLRIVPSKKFAAVVLTNSEEGGTLTFNVVNAATREFLGLSWPEAKPMDLPVEVLSTYSGKYDAADDLCELVMRDGHLVLHITNKGGFPTPDSPPPENPPPVRMGLYAEDRFILLDDPLKDMRGEFLQNPDGKIAWMRIGGRVHKRVG
jgi:CubicO group peptidase (beta-lactamase class C family)